MYMYDRPSWTGEVYETEAYFPTWINKETAPHVKALVDAHKAMFGDERIGCEPSMDKRTGRPLCDKWTFSTNCVSIQGRYGIPCVALARVPSLRLTLPTRSPTRTTWSPLPPCTWLP